MVILDVKINNFYSFKNFHINFSYPKKIVGSPLEGEHLEGFERFRYKKVNILMGANATGKTTFGKMLAGIFNLIMRRELSNIMDKIADRRKASSLVMDFVPDGTSLYRLSIETSKVTDRDNYSAADQKVAVTSTPIGKADSYEMCAKRLDNMEYVPDENIVRELSKVPELAWHFTFTDDEIKYLHRFENKRRFTAVLKHTLQALDPSVVDVKKIEDVKGAYVVRFPDRDEIIKDGMANESNTFSSGTRAGINIAVFMASMKEVGADFYYCDEKFSYVHTDIEKAFLSVMIDQVKVNGQLFFTTHNSDILDMQLPKHSFIFLKKDMKDKKEPIKCISASDYLKKSTDSLRRAVENDMFSASPEVEKIYEILDI